MRSLSTAVLVVICLAGMAGAAVLYHDVTVPLVGVCTAIFVGVSALGKKGNGNGKLD